MLIIKPDGRISFQSGIGNLGTENMIGVHRVGAEVLGVPWEKCEVIWGNTSKNLPWTCISGGSQTTHAMMRAAHAAAMDAKQKLCQITVTHSQTLAGGATVSLGNVRVDVRPLVYCVPAKVGIRFDWIAYHWIAACVLTVSVVFHVIHASFWLDFWSIWPDRADLEDARKRLLRFAGKPSPPPR